MTFFEKVLNREELALLGENLAAAEKVVKVRGRFGVSAGHNSVEEMLQQIQKTYNRLDSLQTGLEEPSYTPAEEWITDNFITIQNKAEELSENLQKCVSVKLPFVIEDGRKLSRVEVMARELVSHTDGAVTESAVTSFLEGYGRVSGPVTSELTIFPYVIQREIVRRIAKACRMMEDEDRQRLQAVKVFNVAKQYLDTKSTIKALNMWLSDISELTPAFCGTLLRMAAATGKDTAPYREILQKKLEGRGTTLDNLIETEYKIRLALGASVGNAITSLSAILAYDWDKIAQKESAVMGILSKDPSGIFNCMNTASKMQYVKAIEDQAARRNMSGAAVAAEALRAAEEASDEENQNHVGFYIKNAISDKSPLFLSLTAVLTAALAFAPGVVLFMTGWGILLLLPLILLSRQMAAHIAEKILCTLCRTVPLPGLDYSKGLPKESSVVVAMPALLIGKKHVENLFEQLEAIYCGNRQAYVFCALVGDLCDSNTQVKDSDQEIIRAGQEAARRLNDKYGEHFYFTCRGRTWSEGQGKWMGWERKRGALLEFNRRVAGKVRFVLTVDENTLVPTGAVGKMAEIMAHPLNKKYGILQPAISTIPADGPVSFYSRVFTPIQGRDGYGAFGGSFSFDICQEGTYTGKGMYDPVKFNRVCEDLFPDNRILSHDLIEGCFLHCAYTSSVSLYEDFPKTMEQDMKRLHRWTRGDWQLLPYLGSHFIDRNGRRRKNTLSAFCRFKIRDNMVRSLWALSLMLLLLGSLILWRTLPYTLPFIFLSVFIPALLAPSKQAWLQCISKLALAPYLACLMTDAACRALWRLLVSKKRLLEWVTSTQSVPKSPKSVPKSNHESCPPKFRNRYLREARRIWAFYEDYVTRNDHFLPPDNVQFEPVYAVAHRTSPTNIGYYLLSCLEAYTLGFISKTELLDRIERTMATLGKMKQWQGHLLNWYDTISLVPLSPTFISAVDSGNFCACLITLSQGLRMLNAEESLMLPNGLGVTKELMDAAAKNGSEGDYSLWQSKYNHSKHEAAAEEENIKNRQWRDDVRARAGHIADELERIVEATDFTPLYDHGRQLFYTGFNLDTNAPSSSHYDTAASEARLTSYVAIAKGDVDAEHFDRPLMYFGRKGDGVLKAWSGTGFEFYMPELFLKPWKDTLWDLTMEHVTTAQMAYAEQKGIPWGVSESGYNSLDLNLNYKYKAFGVPGLGLKRETVYDPVISPYTSMMVADRYPKTVMKNLEQLQREGAWGTYGFYEAVDYTRDRAGVVSSVMAHHAGMAFAGLTNLLADGYVRNTFNSAAAIRECRILLALRPPKGYKKVTVKAPKSVPCEKRSTQKEKTVSADSTALSNGRYTCILGTDGRGRSYHRDFELTKDSLFVYINNRTDGDLFSAAKYPVPKRPESYRTNISPSACLIERKDGRLSTEMLVCVSPEEDGEIRRMKLNNCGEDTVSLELTAFCRLAMAPGPEWKSHPAFSDIFVTTDCPEAGVLTACSRKNGARSFMTMCADHPIKYAFDTDYNQFLGRNHEAAMPAALENGGTFYGTKGTVLTPCFALSGRLELEPGETASLYVCLGAGEKYQHFQTVEACERAISLSSTMAAIEKEALGISSDERRSFLNMLPYIISQKEGGAAYSDGFYRHTDVGRELAAYSIWGDKPIIAAFVNQMENEIFIRRMAKFWAFCNFRGVPADLVIAAGPTVVPVAQAVKQRWSFRVPAAKGQIFVVSGKNLDCVAAAAALIRKPGDNDLLPGREELYKDTYYDISGLENDRERPEFWVPLMGELKFYNGFGGFRNEGREYVIAGNVRTPAPWINCISNKNFGFLVSETGAGPVWNKNSRENRLTPWFCDWVQDVPTEVIYIRKKGETRYFTAVPAMSRGNFVVRHGCGWSSFVRKGEALETELTVFVPLEEPVKYSVLTLSNTSAEPLELELMYYVKIQEPQGVNKVICSKEEQALLFNCFRLDAFGALTTFMSCSAGIEEFTCDNREFYPEMQKLTGKLGVPEEPCGVIKTNILVEAGKSLQVIFSLGQTFEDGLRADLLRRAVVPNQVMAELNSVQNYWSGIFDCIQVATPDEAFNIMVNSRLLYQVISCRIEGRTAFYQSGGAFGFRDQLQDSLALLFCKPDRVREQILLHCSRQFEEGDVQHWWHPPMGCGIRSQCSDDLLWLPYAVYEYVHFTGDRSILGERVPFLKSPVLSAGEQERYETPEVSGEEASVYEHCVRAVRLGLDRMGTHGLPLIGSCDWNDGMNYVGKEGRGESVWLGWFLCTVLKRMAFLADCMGDSGQPYQRHAEVLAANIEHSAWDQDHYIRAFYDDGSPMNVVDSISQSWSVISGFGDRERSKSALTKADARLVDRENGLIKLLDPPFDGTSDSENPGYIAMYPPGIRENGAQYTHGALWLAKAFLMLGDADRGYELLSMINPINHTMTMASAMKYKTEPYAVAADVCAADRLTGRGGWSWYTGSAAWMYRIMVEDLLGVKCQEGKLLIQPNLPSSWNSYRLKGLIGGEAIEKTVKKEGVNQ